MSLHKAIYHGKEKRKAFRGSKRFDHSCRNHGSCSYCADNRQIDKKRGDSIDSGLEAYYSQSCKYPGER